MSRAASPLSPRLWLVSDARNDAVLERAIIRLPRGSGLIFRHYHLPPACRRARFLHLARLARARGIIMVLADTPARARAWGADGAYGAPRALASPRPPLLRLATAHTLGEMGAANRIKADAVLLSPVWATRSHLGRKPLGPTGFRLLAARAGMKVIALGGMNTRTARRLGWRHWAAIDGLSGIGHRVSQAGLFETGQPQTA